MLEMNLENGKSMTIEDCGDSLLFSLFDEDGVLEKSTNCDSDSIAELVFD